MVNLRNVLGLIGGVAVVGFGIGIIVTPTFPLVDVNVALLDGRATTLNVFRAATADGGFVYVAFNDADGGATYLNGTPCVRRPVGNATCRRGTLFSNRDFGVDNIFPSTEAFGLGCQSTPCVVMFGEDAGP